MNERNHWGWRGRDDYPAICLYCDKHKSEHRNNLVSAKDCPLMAIKALQYSVDQNVLTQHRMRSELADTRGDMAAQRVYMQAEIERLRAEIRALEEKRCELLSSMRLAAEACEEGFPGTTGKILRDAITREEKVNEAPV